MKNLLNISLKSVAIKVAMISAIAFFAVSCEKETMTPQNLDLPGSDNFVTSGNQSITEIALNSDEFNELVSALTYVDEELEAGLVNLFLNGTGQYTVFAPGDEAFYQLYRQLNINMISDLPADFVLDILLYHVVEGSQATINVVPTSDTKTIETLLGKTFTVSSMGSINDKMGNTVSILNADILASNGIIHQIDVVMHPYGRDDLSEVDTIKESEGDNLLVSTSDLSIAEIAIGAGFSELVKALTYVDQELSSGLVNLLKNGTDQYTVFAPTNQAFEALYDALDVDAITDLPASLVRDVLFYHVAEGSLASDRIVPFESERIIETLLGVTFDVNAEGIITAIGNTANIVATDIAASNGIIHVIDSVILPVQ